MVRSSQLAFILTLVATSCGRFGFEATNSEADTALADAALDAETTFSRSFSEGTMIEGLDADGFENDDPTLTGDVLEIYFASGRAGNGVDDFFRATRSAREGSWGAVTRVDELSSTGDESTISISANGLWLLFASTRDDPEQDIYLASRGSRAEPFGSIRRLDELNSVFSDFASWISDDGLTVLIHTTRPDGDDSDVLRATRRSTSALFDPPTVVPGLDSSDNEISATLHFGETLVLFATNGADGSSDLFVAEQAGSGFGERLPLIGPNTAVNEGDAWMSPDGCTLVFARIVGVLRQLHVARCAR